MKIIFLVLLAVSCSSHEPKGTSTGAATSPAKKEAPAAPQKSPYTVGECACMKIFQPVCGSDGRTYGNSCEAECNKVTWKDGGCQK